MLSNAQESGAARLAKLIKGIKVAMLTTVGADGSLRSRPMATQNREFDGDALWFFTRADSPKSQEIEKHTEINLSYSSPDDNKYVSISGQAELVRDRDKLQERWSPLYRAWFSSGIDDPDLVLLKVRVDKAEYWDATASRMQQVAGLGMNRAAMGRAAASQVASRPGQHEQLDYGHEHAH